MNWRRGLSRLWLVASALWIGFWFWYRDVPCALGFNYFGIKWWCSDPVWEAPPNGFLLDLRSGTFALMFGVPAAALVFGLVAQWIASGFGPRHNSN